MARVRISNAVFRLKHGGTIQVPGIPDAMTFINGEEFQIVVDVLYMRGFPLSPAMQDPMIDWIINNKKLFVGDTRNF